jgi:deoxyadenosine/deoxycytidine kinase
MSEKDLKCEFQNFVNKKKVVSQFDEFREKSLKFILENKKAINAGTQITKALTEIATKKSAVSVVHGAFTIVSNLYLDPIYYPADYFNKNNGWEMLTIDKTSVGKMFESTIKEYPYTTMGFKYTNNLTNVYKLPIGDFGLDVAVVKSEYDSAMWFKPEFISKQELFDFLVKSKIEQINSKYFSLDYEKATKWGSSEFVLVAEPNNGMPSIKSKKYVDYISKFNNASINRSILFYGPPGTGKTTLSQAIVKGLNYNTLKIRLDKHEELGVYKFLIERFNVEAVIIDDFDQAHNSNQMLELFEFLNKKVKVTIALANSLKQFHSAILRPGRFDEIIVIDSLEEESIKELLGGLYDLYGSKVVNWPIAYMKELVYKSKFSEGEELQKTFEDLDRRVKLQLEDLKK